MHDEILTNKPTPPHTTLYLPLDGKQITIHRLDDNNDVEQPSQLFFTLRTEATLHLFFVALQHSDYVHTIDRPLLG